MVVQAWYVYREKGDLIYDYTATFYEKGRFIFI